MALFPRKDRRYRVLYDTHAWVGVLASLALYLLFVTGIVALVWEPIAAWEEPAHHVEAAAGDVDQWYAALLDAVPEGAERADLILPDPRVGRHAPTAWVVDADDVRSQWIWDADAWRESRAHAGHFLFSVHFLHHEAVPWLYDVAGLLSVAMLVALLTGLLIHLRDLLPQIDQFRPHLPLRVGWADAHKVTAVLGFPFQLMIAYTAAMIILGNYVIIAIGLPLYGGDVDRARVVAFGERPPPFEAPVEPARSAPASEILARAHEALPGLTPESVRVQHPGRTDARARVIGKLDQQLGYAVVHVAAPNAEVIHTMDPRQATAAGVAEQWITALHFAQIGGWGLELCYALLAAATGATLLTGNELWLARRAKRRGGLGTGDRTLSRLNVGVGAGTIVAVGATLLASRLLPWDLEGRYGAIELAFVASLGASCVVAALVRDPRRAWIGLLGLAGLIFAVLPLSTGLRSDAGALGAGPIGAVVAVDLGCALVALGLGAVAFALARATRVTSEIEAGAEAPPAQWVARG